MAPFPRKRLINSSFNTNTSTFIENPSLSLLSKSAFESKPQQDRKLRATVRFQLKHLQGGRISAECLSWQWNVATGVIASKTPSDGTVTKLLVYKYSQTDSCGTNPHCPLADSPRGCIQGTRFAVNGKDCRTGLLQGLSVTCWSVNGWKKNKQTNKNKHLI